MRVITGIYKRLLITAPPGTDVTRPTSDRVRESLFNILADEVEDKVVLDLFAGSGALGIEALSRGAKKAVFVENNKLAMSCIQKNLESLKIPASDTQIVLKSADDFLKGGRRITESFDIIFVDPPYNMDWWKTGLQTIENSGYCSEKCLVVIEKSSKNKKKDADSGAISVQNWTLQDVRKYGKTELEFWRRNYD